jgi:hypothetical protein
MRIADALFKRYPAPAYALFFEVANATGFSRSRSADAIAMGLWPSRGLDLQGFEFKDSRQDWLNELKNPAKAETIAKYCDQWWLVAGNDTVAKLDEIPKNWGYLLLKGGRLSVMKEAPKLEATPITRGFLAALLRRKHESILDAPEVQAKIDLIRKEATQRDKDNQPTDLKIALKDLERLRETVQKFEKASGVKIGESWRAGDVGQAVAHALNVKEFIERTDAALDSAHEVRQVLERKLGELDTEIRRLKSAKDGVAAPLAAPV